ncbi:hypothetical protein [uncultured Marinobacter sp.]|uniref:hypothetical protein n=1 Tax=uncultured Marinobacter sp. TaxID=187379 RepID=UPI002622CA9D|nr:hypothetical protein [uncultured Marinobacter sp.]
MKPTSFLVRIGNNQPLPSNTSPVYSDSLCSLYVRVHNNKHIQHECNEDGFTVFIGETTRNPLANNITKAPGQGTLIQYQKASGNIVITTDRLGTSLIYYSRDNNDILEISNRLDNLALAGKAPDWSSIQQYLNTGYTIGSNTFFHDVVQTLPNEKLTACCKDGFNIKRTTFKPDQTRSMETDTVDELIDTLSARLSTVLRDHPPSVLMMSAGWDSRTLLISGAENYRTAYTHGDLSSREIAISRSLTGILRMDHVFSDVQNLDISGNLLDAMLEELGFCVFPVWYIAGQRAQDTYNAPLSSGVLGEFLGGHYGLLSIGTRFQKILASASLLPGNLVTDDQFSKALERFTTPAPDHWFLSAAGRTILADAASSTKTIMRRKLDSAYEEYGDWQRALEAFNMEHRARQYILKQAQTAACTSGYITPFADDELAEIVNLIPFNCRVHNTLNQRLLKAKSSPLLNYSMAATLIPAKYPVILQELSRGARIFFEQARKLVGMNQPRLGWFNYEHLYQSNILQEITESLSLTLWDKPGMQKTINCNPKNGIDAGSTLDMLCKIKTVDYYIKMTNH